MLWIIIPVFNEEKSLHNLLPAINRIMIDRDQEYRLVVVNDGSNDCSDDILESYKTNLSLIVLTHPINRGFGDCVGFQHR